MLHFDRVTAGWKILSPFAKMTSFMNFIYFWGRFNQIEVFTKRPNGPVVTGSLCISIIFAALTVYTSIFYIMLGEFSKAVPSYCMAGLIASTSAAAWNIALKDRMKWVPLLESAAQKVYRDDKRPTVYNRICTECMDDTLKKFILTITVIMISFIAALIGPVYTYLHDGSFVTLLEFRIPFLTGQPEKEFIINSIWQAYISTVGVAALFVIEGMFAIVNNTITVSSKLTVQEFYDLSDQLEVSEISGKESEQKLTKIFMTIINMDGYIDTFRDLTYWRLLLSPPSFTIAIAISIYSQFMLGYPAGYGIAIASYVQMAVLCITGQNIIDRNERILEALYQFKWYLLPTKYQKDVMYMIQHLQNMKGLTIGPFEPLNYETLKVLTQKIYSFLMFLFNVSAE